MAVYTEVSDEALEAFLSGYDIGDLLSFKGIAEGVENSNYLLHTEAGSFILTLYEKRVEETDLPFFLGLMTHLAAKGFRCPTPVAARNGQMLGRLADRPAAIVSFLDGVWVRRPLPTHCGQLGAAIAELHLAAQDFSLTRPNALGPAGWQSVFEGCRDGCDTIVAGLRDELSAELDFISKAWPQDLPQGVIHGDLFPDNVFFIRSQLSGFIDFYFACNDMLSYDLAITLNAWCFEEDGSFNVTKSRALLMGYHKVRPLQEAELAALPALARGSALRFVLTRLYDWINQVDGAFVTPKDPLDYLRRLRFHRDVTGPQAYGFE